MIVRFMLFATFLVLSSTFANAERPIRGTYQVPVPDSLKSFANYPVKFKADDYQKNPNQISFPMPATLLGQETVVTMSKVDGSDTTWEGPNVRGNCEAIVRYFRCTVRFDAVSVDPLKLEAAIKNQYKTSGEIDGRMKVARVFSAEPIGILIYKMRGRGY